MPGVTNFLISYKIDQENASQSYDSIKNQAIKAIEAIKYIINNPHVKGGFGIKTIDQWCEDIRFAKSMISNINQGRTLPALGEGPESVEYQEFEKLLEDFDAKCGFKGGKIYKLKGRSKKQNKTKISKKYKGKSKTFKKSKRLGK